MDKTYSQKEKVKSSAVLVLRKQCFRTAELATTYFSAMRKITLKLHIIYLCTKKKRGTLYPKVTLVPILKNKNKTKRKS